MRTEQRDSSWIYETEQLKSGFQELIVSREALRIQIERLKSSRRTVKRLRRVERSIQRQALNLLQDLFELGLSRAEIGALYGDAEKTARIRHGVAV